MNDVHSFALKPRLLMHEWLSVCLILGLLTGLTLTVLFFRMDSFPESSSQSIEIIEQEIDVRIEGAVEKPGTYRIKKGTELRELLDKAIPKEEANLSRLKLERRLMRKNQVIKIPAKKTKQKRTKNHTHRE